MLDAQSGGADERDGCIAGVEMQVRSVEYSTIVLRKPSGHHDQSGGQVSDVRQRDEEHGIFGGRGDEVAQDRVGIGSVLQDIGAHDHRV